jgi:hypothetical protein
MNIRVEKVGGIWHGTIDGHPEIDERGLTEEIARRKVEEIARGLAARGREVQSVPTPRSDCESD